MELLRNKPPVCASYSTEPARPKSVFNLCSAEGPRYDLH